MVSDLDTSVRMRPCSRESRLLAFLNLQERNKGDCIMTELLKAIGKHVAREIKSQPEPPERTEQMLFMYNRVDRRTKAYKDWITGKLSLSEAYAMAKDAS